MIHITSVLSDYCVESAHLPAQTPRFRLVLEQIRGNLSY